MSGPRKLKVLFVLDEFPDPHAGTEGQFLLLLSLLDRSRIEPAVVLLRPSRYLQAHLSDVPVKVLGVPRLRSATGLWRIFRAALDARREGFEVAHIFFNDSAMVFPLPLKLCGLKVVVARRDLGFWYTRWNLPVLRLAGYFVDAVVANSAAVREVVANKERIPRKRIAVIYNGMRRSGTCTQGRRADFGVPEDGAVITCVANLRPLKRIGDIIRALPAITRAAGPTHLLVVGEDRAGEGGGKSHRAELEALARDFGLDGRVHFAGKMDNPMSAVALAEVCLLVSQTEGLSNVVVEYMYAGKPTVCTKVGGNPEIIIDGVTGLLVDVGEVDQIATAVASLLADREYAKRIGDAARLRAMELFAPGAMTEKHRQLYESLSRSGGRAI